VQLAGGAGVHPISGRRQVYPAGLHDDLQQKRECPGESGTYYDCKNSDKTTWGGAAIGLSIEGGKEYVGVGYLPHNYTWDCGT
jgi:hypothetical protein